MLNNTVARKEPQLIPFYVGKDWVSDNKLALAHYGEEQIMECYEPVYELCGFRHDNPITKGCHVFPKSVENPLDMYGMEQYAKAFLLSNGYGIKGRHTLYIVVTGLTTALISLLNACVSMYDENGAWIDVCLLHWDRDTSSYTYRRQWVYSRRKGWSEWKD